MQSDNQVSNVEQKPKIVTGFIHYDKEDDLTKIFNVLQDFRSRRGLKFSHHRGQIFFSIRSEHLDELHTMQQYKISKYSTRTTYECDQIFGNRLVSQRDSFLRMTYQDDAVLFSSRTPPRIHYQLVQRVFKDTNSFFDKQKYILCKKDNDNENNENNDDEEKNEYIKITRTNSSDRVNKKPYQPRFHNNTSETIDEQATPVPSKGRGRPYQPRTVSESFNKQERSSTTEQERSSTTEQERSSTTERGRPSTTEQERSSTTEQERSSTTERGRPSTTERGRPSTRGRGRAN
jgi:hypothetical protein